MKWGWKSDVEGCVLYFIFSGVLMVDVTLNLPKIRNSMLCRIGIVLVLIDI